MNAVISAFMALAQLVGVVVLAVCAMFALAAFVKKVIRSGHVELQQAGGKPRRVLVTGCDTGFGNMVAKKLHAEGWRVVAACLTEQAAQALNTECGDRCVSSPHARAHTHTRVAFTTWPHILHHKLAWWLL